LAGGVNLYAYAGNNPASYSDPFGLCKWMDQHAKDCDFDGDGRSSGSEVAAYKVAHAESKIGRAFWNVVGVFNTIIESEVGANAVALIAGTRGEVMGAPSSIEPEGPHTTFRADPEIGRITHYETRQPQTDPRNPNQWETVKRYDGTGKAHFNKATQEYVPTPHVHEPNTPGGVRPATPQEIPQ
jgi:hypothetical protein